MTERNGQKDGNDSFILLHYEPWIIGTCDYPSVYFAPPRERQFVVHGALETILWVGGS